MTVALELIDFWKMSLRKWSFCLFSLIGMLCACTRILSPKGAYAAALPTTDKASRTPPEQKIDSRLLQALKGQKLPPHQQNPGELRPSPVASDGIAMVDIDAEVTARLLARIRTIGGRVISAFAQYHAIRAAIPLDRLLELAAMREVRFIRPAERPITNQIPPR